MYFLLAGKVAWGKEKAIKGVNLIKLQYMHRGMKVLCTTNIH
jgi:hypothetical protein